MSRACVTHFDSDPVVTLFWLLMFDNYWRESIGTVYANLCFDPTIVDDNIIIYQQQIFNEYPELEVNLITHPQTPEITNNQLLPKVKEDYIFLTETDNFIFDYSLIDSSFNKLKFYDIVAPAYHLMPDGRGLMRSMFFISNHLLKKIDINFLPRQSDIGDLDCFGWICYQLYKLNLKIHHIPNHNLTPDNALLPYLSHKYVHVRQFNSSNLGYGTKNFYYFLNRNKVEMNKIKLILENNSEAIWQYVKNVAFRKLMLKTINHDAEIVEFLKVYADTLQFVEDYLCLPKERILEIEWYYKGLFNI